MNFRSLASASLFSILVVRPLILSTPAFADDVIPNVSKPVAHDKHDVAWPEFRGPGGQGHSPAVGLPITWSENENIAWKASLPGRGWSSPVIRGEQIWLTAADEDGKTLRALRLDRATGAIDRDVVVATLPDKGPAHDKNTLASPTPLLDEDRVYVHFGPYATACLSDEGKIIWQTALPHQQAYGPSSSPVLFNDVLIVPCLGTDTRYMIALDRRTGEQRWKQAFEGRNAESTPLVIETETGAELISHQADRIVALDPATGNELWSIAQENFAQIPRPWLAWASCSSPAVTSIPRSGRSGRAGAAM